MSQISSPIFQHFYNSTSSPFALALSLQYRLTKKGEMARAMRRERMSREKGLGKVFPSSLLHKLCDEDREQVGERGAAWRQGARGRAGL